MGALFSSQASIFASVTAVFLFGLAMIFLFSPRRGFEATGHTEGAMGRIMAGRYLFMVAILLGAAYLGNPAIIAALLFVLGGLALFDAAVYFTRGEAVWKHLAAGIVAIIVAGIVIGGAG